MELLLCGICLNPRQGASFRKVCWESYGPEGEKIIIYIEQVHANDDNNFQYPLQDGSS